LDRNIVVKGVLGINFLIILETVLAFSNIFPFPVIRSENAVNYLAFPLLVAGLVLWCVICVSDKNAVRRLKNWADLFWNAWSYYGAYSLTRVVITGKDNIKEVLYYLPLISMHSPNRASRLT